MIRALLAIAVFLLLAGGALAQTSITLRPSVSVATLEQPIRLGDAALIDGPDASRWAALVLGERTPDAPEPRIDVAEVRAALAKAGVNWGRVTLTGNAVRIRCEQAPAPPAGRAASVEPKAEFEPLSAAESGTVRGVVWSALAGLYGLPPEAVRLRLPNLEDRDAAVLAQRVGSRRVEAQPGASSLAGRVPIRVDIYQGDRLEVTRQLSAEVQVRRPAAVAASTIDREQAVTPEMLSAVDRWMSPGEPTPITPSDAAGMIARRRIEAGKMISPDDLQSPVVVNKGDLVLVHVLSGDVAMKARARAMQSARDGETIRLQIDGSKKTFQARMNGRGNAVLVMDSADVQAAVFSAEAAPEGPSARSPARSPNRSKHTPSRTGR